MVQTNKILTVSYGTFSCTLEGFDDSFGTMKAIANYFHDLAAEDRYFGAEPPQPDAEMLARIAQREISRRVEARQGEDGIVLRAEAPSVALPPVADIGAVTPGGAPQDRATARKLRDLDRGEPEEGEPDADARVSAAPRETPEECRTDVPVPVGEILDESPGEAPWPETDQLAELMPQPQLRATTAQDSITVKLQRIRAVVSRSRTAAQSGDFCEDEHAEAMFTAFDDGLSEAITDPDDAAKDLPGSGPDMPDALPPGPQAVATELPLAADRDPATDLDATAPADAPDDEQDVSWQPQADGPADVLAQEAQETQDASAAAAETGVPRGAPQSDEGTPIPPEPAEIDPPHPASFLSSRKGRADADRPCATDDAAREAGPDMLPAAGSDESANDAPIISAANLLPDAAHPKEEQQENEAPTPRPHLLRLKRAEIDTALDASRTASVEPDTSARQQDAGELIRGLLGAGGVSSADPEEETVREGPAVDRASATAEPEARDRGVETNAECGSDGDSPPENQRPYLLVNRCDSEIEGATPSTGGEIAAAAEDVAPDTSEDHSDGIPATEREERDDAVAAQGSDFRSGANDRAMRDIPADLETVSEPVGAENASEGADETEEDGAELESDLRDSDTTRLMSVAQSIMNEPQNAASHEMHSRLRAAAATVKKSLIGPKGDNADDAEIYRRDLASFVRPRRPVTTPRSAERPGSAERPAPLKLVEELRVDGPAGTRPSGPIRPRRIMATPGEAAEPAAPDGGESDFVSFAETMGATELPDLLEAAAAYLSFVEGRAQFSRPQLMKRVREVEIAGFNREDGLRSFGLLLRAGKIEKAGSGRFTVSDEIGFRPDSRMN